METKSYVGKKIYILSDDDFQIRQFKKMQHSTFISKNNLYLQKRYFAQRLIYQLFIIFGVGEDDLLLMDQKRKNKYNIIMDINIESQIGMKVERVLGRGSFATVYYCIDNITSRPFAVKIFLKKDFTKNKLQSFRKQAQLLASIQHKNIVKFKSFKQTDTCLYLIMQYIAGGTLKQLMSDRWAESQQFSDEETALVLKSLLEGIKYLHKFNIIHRDLKPENILVADPMDLGSVKIVDFGLSAQIQAGSPTNVKSQCGTLLYMAPQILHQPSYSKAVDIWSCAVIMYILYIGKHPIYVQGMKSQQFKEKLKSCCFPPLPNPLANNFIKNLSKIQYTQRYSVNEALKHPWITRNEEDQIPLSVNQSIHSFNTSHLIADTFKFVFSISSLFPHPTTQISAQYRNKIKNFIQKHEQSRGRSPSYKKTRRRTNEVFVKIKQLMDNKQKDLNEKLKESQYMDLQSPVIRRHEKLFMRLFQKNKQQSRLITLELCQKPEDEKIEIVQDMINPGSQEQKIQQQLQNPLALSYSSKGSTRNGLIGNYDVQLPLIKITQRKQKVGLRKLNSLREETYCKHQQNYSYFKNCTIKNSQESFRETVNSSKSKNIGYKSEQYKQQVFIKNSPKKPQTAERGKTGSKGKDSRPMIFGLRGSNW